MEPAPLAIDESDGDASPEGPWASYARRWSALGPPQRPSPEDVGAALSEVRAWHAESAARVRALGGQGGALDVPPPRALLLGVTPEIATMDWPPGTSLLAVDRSEPMIRAVLPKVGVPADTRAALADWLSLPVSDASVDVAIGDGCLSTFSFPDGVRALAREVRRALVPDGRLVMRVYTAPPEREEIGAIARDLQAGAIGSFHVVKWRVAMALERAPGAGVVLDDVRRAILDLGPLVSALTGRPGFEPRVIETLDAYAGSTAAYTFPTAEMLGEALSGTFEITNRILKTYELGDRCPTLVLRPVT